MNNVKTKDQRSKIIALSITRQRFAELKELMNDEMVTSTSGYIQTLIGRAKREKDQSEPVILL